MKPGGQVFSVEDRANILSRRFRRTILPEELVPSISVQSPFAPDTIRNPVECSTIGTELKIIIESFQGHEVQCGDCKAEIVRLNRMLPHEVTKEAKTIADAIVERGKTKAARWHQRMAATWAPELVSREVQSWIHTAIQKSRAKEDAHFCWIYLAAPAEADEIMWSIRSVQQNFQGTARITVIGDRPAGYTGHCIEQPRVPEQPFRRYRDTLSKIRTMITSPEITGTIVWNMDDCYYLKRGFRLADIATPRVNPNQNYPGSDEWSVMQRATEAAIRAKGLEYANYVTHLPQVVDREKLLSIFEQFDFSQIPLCWESLYGCVYYPGAETYHGTLQRIGRRRVAMADCEHTKQTKVVLNHHHGSWSLELYKWLQREFGNG